MNAQAIVDLLNEAAKLDKNAMYALCFNRVPCNDKLAFHPTIQVGGISPERASVGMLGILNGITALPLERYALLSIGD